MAAARATGCMWNPHPTESRVSFRGRCSGRCRLENLRVSTQPVQCAEVDANGVAKAQMESKRRKNDAVIIQTAPGFVQPIIMKFTKAVKGSKARDSFLADAIPATQSLLDYRRVGYDAR